MSALKYWLWLCTRSGLSNGVILRILERFGTPEDVYFTDPEGFQRMEVTARASAVLADKSMNQVDHILDDCQRLGVRMITIGDTEYPSRLTEIPNPPVLLYVRGNLPVLDERVTVAVVGTRKPTPYGVHIADRLGRELVQGGAVVVSGIAQGLDTVAIKGALRAGGTVVSVVGNGVDVPYPKENAALYQDIAATGALISEYPPGTQPRGHHFPSRNRIISGLSLGVVVVEGGEKSGTMITAHQALDQGRDTFAVPGPVDGRNSVGPNNLIRQGEAKLVTCALDILEEYTTQFPNKLHLERLTKGVDPSAQAVVVQEKRAQPTTIQASVTPKEERVTVSIQPYVESTHGTLSPEERKLLEITATPRTVEEILELCGMQEEAATTLMTILEMRDLLGEVPVRRYQAKVAL